MMKHSSDSDSYSSANSSSSSSSLQSLSDSPIKGLHKMENCNFLLQPANSNAKKFEYQHQRKSFKLPKVYRPRQRLSKLTNATSTKPHDEPMQKRHMYFAVDCEMVGVGPGGLDSALARLSIVNWDNEIVLDTYVKVAEPVTDYRTFVSGIKPEHIQSTSAMSLARAQLKAKNILMGKILIGHGLTNDLKVIGIDHPWTDVRDTATYQPFMRERQSENAGVTHCPRKLRDLAWEQLGTQIQVMGKSHSPIEDALTSMALYKRVRNDWELQLAKQVQKREQMIKQRVVPKPMRFVNRRVGVEQEPVYVVPQHQVQVGVPVIRCTHSHYRQQPMQQPSFRNQHPQAPPMMNQSRIASMRQAQCDAEARAAAALQHHVSMQRNSPSPVPMYQSQRQSQQQHQRQPMTVIPGYRTHCM